MRVIDLPVAHEDGSFVSAKVSRIVELIREYAPGIIDVRWIPPAVREPGDAAFCIVERTLEDEEPVWRTVMTVQTEEEMTPKVLARIIEADSQRRGGTTSETRLEALKEAYSRVKQREREDLAAQRLDEARFLWRTPLHTVRNFKGIPKLHL